jgi:uncharacterized protein YjbI with pentapeptide repeats
MNTLPVRPLLTLKLATLTSLAFLMLLVSGCHWVGIRGNGHVVTETRQIGNFSRLEADGAFTINWTSGPPKLSITTDENLFEYIRTNLSEDRLRIEWIKPLKGTRGIRVDVSSPTLSHVTLNGAVKFTATNLSGSEFYLDGNGATRATLSGNVNAMSAELNGASRVDAEGLTVRAMELNISGAGKADVHVTEALKVTISGAGKVTYTGDPKVSRDITGAGSVRKKD